MSDRHIDFEIDGHRFHCFERTRPGEMPGADPLVHWEVSMDGALALEFTGEYPYRDNDVRRRVVEWYGTQKPR